jgi:hypothetical protein
VATVFNRSYGLFLGSGGILTRGAYFLVFFVKRTGSVKTGRVVGRVDHPFFYVWLFIFLFSSRSYLSLLYLSF